MRRVRGSHAITWRSHGRPAHYGVYFKDYLALLDRLAASGEFAVYLAQLNMLRLPKLLEQVPHMCLTAAQRLRCGCAAAIAAVCLESCRV